MRNEKNNTAVEVAELMTGEHGWSQKSSYGIRRSIWLNLLNYKSDGKIPLWEFLKTNLQTLKNTTQSPLEISDLIKAMALLFPENLADVIFAAESSSRFDDPHAVGVVVGCFEVATMPGGQDCDEALIKFLHHCMVDNRFWSSPDCVVFAQVSGRLSNSLKQFVRESWGGETPRVLLRISRIMGLIEGFKSNDMNYLSQDNLHEHLIKEIGTHLFIGAPGFYRTLILNEGLAKASAKFTETLVAA